MRNGCFTILNNYGQKISIIGALSSNEKSLITHMITNLLRSGIRSQRCSCNPYRSTNEEIDNYLRNNCSNKIAQVNISFNSKEFIQISNID